MCSTLPHHIPMVVAQHLYEFSVITHGLFGTLLFGALSDQDSTPVNACGQYLRSLTKKLIRFADSSAHHSLRWCLSVVSCTKPTGFRLVCYIVFFPYKNYIYSLLSGLEEVLWTQLRKLLILRILNSSMSNLDSLAQLNAVHTFRHFDVFTGSQHPLF